MPGVEISAEKNRRIILIFDIFCDEINTLETDFFDLGGLLKREVRSDHIIRFRSMDFDNKSRPGFRAVGRDIDHIQFFDFMNGKNSISINTAGAFAGFTEDIVHSQFFGKISRLINAERTVGFDIHFVQDNGFSYTLGAGGVSTGSKSVLTINLNRCIQYAVKNGRDYLTYLAEVVDLVHKVQLAYDENLKALKEQGMLPLFDAGFINIGRQYLTVGINGLVEAAEFLGIEINDNPEYVQFVQNTLGLIEEYNKKYRSKTTLFNCEMIPAENVGVKHAKWDREDGYAVPRDCYNSYFYIVEDKSLNIIDKMRLHGRKYIEHLTGGSALHLNLEEHLTKAQYSQLLRVAAQEGCNYFTFNIPNTICNKCGHISKHYLKECPECHSEDIDYLTRIIGYMKRVSNFSMARQEEAARRHYHRNEGKPLC